MFRNKMVELLIKDTLKEDKPSNKEHFEGALFQNINVLHEEPPY